MSETDAPKKVDITTQHQARDILLGIANAASREVEETARSLRKQLIAAYRRKPSLTDAQRQELAMLSAPLRTSIPAILGGE